MIHSIQKNEIHIATCPNPFTLERVDMCVPNGLCVREMLEIASPRALDLSAIVYVDDMPVERDRWETVYPRPGQLVTVRVIPAGGRSGKNVLRIVLSLAVMATTYWLGGPITGALGKWVGGFALGGIGAAGVYGVTRLVPLPEPTTDPTEGRVYSVTGQNNRMNLYGPIPKIYGRMKVYPSLGARPYTEIVGNDQYMRLLFVVGYGTLYLSDFKLNDEPLENFVAEIDTCTGADGDDTVGLFTNNIYEESLSLLLKYTDGWVTRTTHINDDADEISIDFTFPMGLCDYADIDDDGTDERINQTVSVEVQYRPAEQGYLLYDGQTAAFATGETLTGGTSGATAEILEDTDWGTEGCLRVWKVVGTFQNNEAITDSQGTPGTAVVNGTFGDLLLSYDNEASGPFTVANTITGGTSGTIGTLRGLQDDGATGRLVIEDANGDYDNNEQISDGTATADANGDSVTPPWLPNEDSTIENICPGFDEWTLGGSASYNSGTGEITLTAEGDYVESPEIAIGYSPEYDFIAEYYSTDASTEYSPDAGYYLTATNYAYWSDWQDEGQTTENSDGEVTSIDTDSYSVTTWSEKTFEGTGGAMVRYVKIKIESLSPYTAASYLIKNPEVIISKTYTFTAKTNRTYRRSARWPVNDPGRYEVRCRRVTADSTQDNEYDEMYWTALRSIMNEEPITGIDNLAKIALRVKATDQLGGMVDRFSCIASSVLPVYSTSTETWTDTETANPAWAYCDVLRSAANKKAVAASRLDLTTLTSWAGICTTLGKEFNADIDKRMTVFETLRAIASVGQAGFAINDPGLYSVVMDYYKSAPVQHITPRNSWGFTGAKTFYEYPHALKMKFINAEEDYLEDEIIVYDDGYDSSNATRFETIELWGVTDSDQAWKAGRYHLAVMRLRPEVWTVNMDVENLICQRGDRVYVNHDVPMIGLGFARIKSVTFDDPDSTVVLDGDLTMEDGESYGLRVRKASGSSVTTNIVNHGGTSNEVTVAGIDATSYFAADNLVMFGLKGAEDLECIVQSIVPGPDLTARLTLVEYNTAIYTASTGTIPEHDSNISVPPDTERVPVAPSIYQIRSDEGVLYRAPDGSIESQIVVELAKQSASDIKPYTIGVEYRERDADEDWQRIPDYPADNTEIYIRPVQDGETYDIRLRYVSYYGKASLWTEAIHTVVGKTSAPADVDNLYYKLPSRLEWTYTAPLDFAGFEVRYNVGSDSAWVTATKAHDGLLLASYFDIGTFSGGTMTWMVKAVDTSGNYSDTAATLIKDLGDPLEANVIITTDLEGDGYPGEQTNCSVDGSNDLVADSSGTLFWKDDNELFWGADADTFWDTWYLSMVYTLSLFPNPTDAGCNLWLDYTETGLKHLKYRKTDPTESDDYADFSQWETPTDGTWTIVSGECQVVHDAVAGGNQTRQFSTALGGQVKTYISIKVRSDDVSNAQFGVSLYGQYFNWIATKHNMTVDGDVANEPGWEDNTNAYWLFEILTDGTINWYKDGEFMDSGSVQSWSSTNFHMLVRADISGPINNYFDELRIWYPDSDWVVWPGMIETDTDELYEMQFTHSGGTTQAKITALSIKQDVDDIVEYLDDEVIAASGTVYLGIAETYRAVTHVSLTLQDDAGTAVSAKCMDKNPGSSNGPEVECYNASGTRVAGLVDATVRGY